MSNCQLGSMMGKEKNAWRGIIVDSREIMWKTREIIIDFRGIKIETRGIIFPYDRWQRKKIAGNLK